MELRPPTNKDYRNFALIVGGIFLIISLWPLLFRGNEPYWWLTGVAGTLMAVGLIFPKVLAPVYRVWMKIGEVLGWINSHIILGIIFYGLFTPIALFFKVTKKDPMHRKLDPQKASYWEERSDSSASDSMKYQF